MLHTASHDIFSYDSSAQLSLQRDTDAAVSGYRCPSCPQKSHVDITNSTPTIQNKKVSSIWIAAVPDELRYVLLVSGPSWLL